MKTPIVLTLSIFAQVAGNLLLSKVMRTAGTETLEHWFNMALHTAQNPVFWLGTVLLIVFFALRSAVLSWADLSFVLPASSFGYILNVLFAHRFLGESVSATRWAGTLLITLGVLFVSRSAAAHPGKEAA